MKKSSLKSTWEYAVDIKSKYFQDKNNGGKRVNALVPKHRMHYHPDTSLGESNRKQGLNLCWGQRLPRFPCCIYMYATLDIKFSWQVFFKANISSINNNFRTPFWMTIWCMKKNLLMCFQSLSDPCFSFLNSLKLNLEERHLACGFKCTPRN